MDAVLGIRDRRGKESRNKMKLSIITVTRNEAEGLQRTIESVELFAPSDSEYIVIDGASADDSVAILKGHTSRITYWISEPDRGIYDAMNKGLARATGDYCLFLNSGDRLIPGNGLAELVDAGADIYFSDAVLESRGARIIQEYPERVDAAYFISGMINHQNSLIRRELLISAGGFDATYRICADWLFFLRTAYEYGIRFEKLAKPIAEFGIGGISSRPGSDSIVDAERERGIREVFGSIAPSIQELLAYRNSVYGNILHLFGASPVLENILLVYRFFARRLVRRPRDR
jgi:glycosyltransferase involved in cell wall biosynthesis